LPSDASGQPEGSDTQQKEPNPTAAEKKQKKSRKSPKKTKSPKKKLKLLPRSTSKVPVPASVTQDLHDRLDKKQPRHRSSAFKQLAGRTLSWRDRIVLETVRFAREQGLGNISPAVLNEKAAK
jgi:hypothetical protein